MMADSSVAIAKRSWAARTRSPLRVDHFKAAMVFAASRKAWLPILLAVSCIVAWEVVVDWTQIPTVILAPPSLIFAKIVKFYPMLLANAVPTTLESVLAFFISVALGIVLAAAITYSQLLYDAFYPNLVFFQLIPKIALAPLFIVWFGIDHESRLTFSVFISFFPMLIAATAGFQNVERNVIRLCHSLGATKWQILWNVRFPGAIPFIFSGMKISVTLAIIGIVVGEFITSQAGLGYLILFASGQQDTPLIFASITVLCLAGLVMYAAVVLVERVVNQRLFSTTTR